MHIRKFEIERPGKLLGRIRQSFAKATTQQRKASLIRRHAVAERHAIEMMNLVSMPSASSLTH